MDTISKDMARGKLGNAKYIAPVVKKIYGGSVCLTDRQGNQFERALDVDACIDGLIFSDAGLIPFASRVQFGKNHEAFSTRYERPTNTPTEYPKILAAIKNALIRPFVHLQGFVDEYGSAVVGVVRTADLWQYLEKNLPRLKSFTNTDDTKFVVAFWRDLRRAGVRVREFVVSANGDVKELGE